MFKAEQALDTLFSLGPFYKIYAVVRTLENYNT